ncbi:hypothetical protein IMSHALPRED_004609 [Imshaugia aleurites]|uniref:Uncharacterized protein n=1 Tax=Imshaugia aleurites TaxID=172621 RepID=A0A8H3J944_9LECA|nr:hypothetical protein IMSHALPRED_004609 [Imshaugia aleurites]
MTLVFKTNSGSLIQAQVQTQDVVNTWSAAQAIYGWMGGLEGAKFLLSQIPNPLGPRIKELKLDQSLRLLPFRGHVLTSGGHLIAESYDSKESFGDDIRTQLIGTTICALSHECESLTAARLFCRFLMPYLFGESSSVTYALQSQVIEKSNLQKVVNEGASRGLPRIFLDTIREEELPEANQGWRYVRSNRSNSDDDEFFGETTMIAGLLKWIAKDGAQEYRTRSGCVARVAACLKAVGFRISSIQIYSGYGPLPSCNGPKTLTLVLGGSIETDNMMQELPQLPDTPRILHYQFNTMGAMLLSALGNAPNLHPEILQEDFEHVFEYIEEQLSITFVHGDPIPEARYLWKHVDKPPKAVAMSLASIHFSECAEFVAPCYDRIANEQYLDRVRGKSKKLTNSKAKWKELARFRAITASIVISIVSRFAPTSFKHVHHATTLDISSSDWLSMMCKVVDRVGSSDPSIKLYEAVVALAIVHAAYEPPLDKDIQQLHKSIVAWRNGIFGVVPALLLDMNVLEEGLPLVCIDYFWANVSVLEDGSILSAHVADVEHHFLDMESTDSNLSSLQRLDEPRVGDPECSAPDLPVYLSLSTPMDDGDPHLCFTAWLRGTIAGTVGILEVLKTLLASRVEPARCPGHDKAAQVVNVKTSTWSADLYSKPRTKDFPIFLPVSEDNCWALFLAGQTCNFKGRVVYRCVACAVENFQSTYTLHSGSDPAAVFIGLL